MRTLNTITVGELIEALQGRDLEAKVAFSSDYGDHCHTRQVLGIRGEVESERLYETAYSDSGFAVQKDPDDTRGGETVLIIS